MKYTAFKDNLEDAKKIKLVSKMLKLDSGLGILGSLIKYIMHNARDPIIASPLCNLSILLTNI